MQILRQSVASWLDLMLDRTTATIACSSIIFKPPGKGAGTNFDECHAMGNAYKR
jgi:hypothetical protein